MKIKSYTVTGVSKGSYTETVKGIGTALKLMDELKTLGADYIEIIDNETNETEDIWSRY